MKIIVALILLISSLCGREEVIQIAGPLTGNTPERLWPLFSGGTIIITKEIVAIPNGSQIYLQSRKIPYDQTTIPISKKVTSDINIYQICLSDTFVYCTFFAVDGRVYMLRKHRVTGEVLGPFLKHWKTARILLMNENKLLVTGYYRPGFIDFMDRTNDKSVLKQSAATHAKYDDYFKKVKAFSLAYYDKDLNLIDSANTIERTGEDMRTLERLYILHPIDMTDLGELYLIDNSQGYMIEKYTSDNELEVSFEVKNRNFKKIPENLNESVYYTMGEKNGSYSSTYALFLKNNLILSSFFQAPAHGEKVEGPYYYDISTLEGDHVFTGVLEYPIITEDETDKVFLYVKREGGWFEDDTVFLVGLTIQDFMDGKGEKKVVDAAIDSFLAEQ